MNMQSHDRVKLKGTSYYSLLLSVFSFFYFVWILQAESRFGIWK